MFLNHIFSGFTQEETELDTSIKSHGKNCQGPRDAYGSQCWSYHQLIGFSIWVFRKTK